MDPLGLTEPMHDKQNGVTITLELDGRAKERQVAGKVRRTSMGIDLIPTLQEA